MEEPLVNYRKFPGNFYDLIHKVKIKNKLYTIKIKEKALPTALILFIFLNAFL